MCKFSRKIWRFILYLSMKRERNARFFSSTNSDSLSRGTRLESLPNRSPNLLEKNWRVTLSRTNLHRRRFRNRRIIRTDSWIDAFKNDTEKQRPKEEKTRPRPYRCGSERCNFSKLGVLRAGGLGGSWRCWWFRFFGLVHRWSTVAEIGLGAALY